MLTELVGVLDDGSVQTDDAPVNPRTTLHIQLGASQIVRLRVVRPDGTPVTLTGCSLVLTAKRRPQDAERLLSKVGALNTARGLNCADFVLAPTDTHNVMWGHAVYDIWLTDSASQRNPVIPASPMIFDASVAPIP